MWLVEVVGLVFGNVHREKSCRSLTNETELTPAIDLARAFLPAVAMGDPDPREVPAKGVWLGVLPNDRHNESRNPRVVS